MVFVRFKSERNDYMSAEGVTWQDTERLVGVAPTISPAFVRRMQQKSGDASRSFKGGGEGLSGREGRRHGNDSC